MRRFRFRLDRLLAIRGYREREWEIRLADITRICMSLDRQLRDLVVEKARNFGSGAANAIVATGAVGSADAARAAGMADAAETAGDTEAAADTETSGDASVATDGAPGRRAINMSDYVARVRYVQYLDRRIAELARELAVRQVERDETREKYLESSRAKKVLEKLKERRAGEHYRESLAHEAAIIDDIATAQSVRAGMEGENGRVGL